MLAEICWNWFTHSTVTRVWVVYTFGKFKNHAAKYLPVNVFWEHMCAFLLVSRTQGCLCSPLVDTDQELSRWSAHLMLTLAVEEHLVGLVAAQPHPQLVFSEFFTSVILGMCKKHIESLDASGQLADSESLEARRRATSSTSATAGTIP